MKYRIQLTAESYVKGYVEVEADSEQIAKLKATNVALNGDVDWIYDSVVDDSVYVTNVKEIP